MFLTSIFLTQTLDAKIHTPHLNVKHGAYPWFAIQTSVCLLLAPLLCRAGTVFDACDYPDDAAAAQAWLARDDSPPAVMREVDGKRSLAFECRFAGSARERNSWDREINLDLAGAESVQFEILCRDAGAVSSFSLYFRMGDGWRMATFAPRRSNRWETITLRKIGTRDEGNPGSWGEVTGLRLAAWKAKDADTVFHIRNLRRVGVLGEDTGIVLARNGADGKDPFADQLSKLLGSAGLRHCVVEEEALTPDLLAKAELVMLPHNPKVPDAAVEALRGFLDRGGRLMAFYALPRGLREAAGVENLLFVKPEREGQFSAIHALPGAFQNAPERTAQSSWNIHAPVLAPGKARVLAEWRDAAGEPAGYPAIVASDRVIFMSHVLLDDRAEHKERLLLAMAGLLRPDCWREVIASHRARMESIADFESYEAARKALLKQTKPGSEARARLEEAAQLLGKADELIKQSEFVQALEATDLADRRLREAFCLAQEPKPGELRAMWCHHAYGVKGMSWDAAIAILKENGFTAVLPNMLWGGVAYYPSEVLPVAPSVAEKGDAVAECLAACRKHGLEMHVWKVDWNLGRDVPAAFVDRLREEGRLQCSYKGEEEPWLCPSHPENVKLERESLLELARKYAIDGIHFDYIRYPGPDYCFCESCRQRFEQATGKAVANWPVDARKGGSRRDEWVVWCQENINTLVRTTSEQVRKVRPGIRVSAAVFRNWDVDSRSVMQDWKLWCEKGWLDFLCPMNYTASDGTFESWVRRQKELVGTVDLVPGIGASSSHVSMTADQVIGQIDITRRYGTRGFIIFNYGEREARETIPMLGLGVTRVR